MAALTLSRFEGVAYRGVSGVKPLWRTPNLTPGRYHTAAPLSAPAPPDAVPVQYLALHPMGPMAELVRHHPVVLRDLNAVTRTVFALRLVVDGILHVRFETAERLGIRPDDLVGDGYDACRAWLAALRRREPGLVGLRVPSAALPGTENLVLLGPRTPIGYDARPRRVEYLPAASVASDGHPHLALARAVHVVGAATPHPALQAWRDGRGFQLRQPDAA